MGNALVPGHLDLSRDPVHRAYSQLSCMHDSIQRLPPHLRLLHTYLKTLPTLIVFPLVALVGRFAPQAVLDKISEQMAKGFLKDGAEGTETYAERKKPRTFEV